jgi:hypothetical protein
MNVVYPAMLLDAVHAPLEQMREKAPKRRMLKR